MAHLYYNNITECDLEPHNKWYIHMSLFSLVQVMDQLCNPPRYYIYLHIFTSRPVTLTTCVITNHQIIFRSNISQR